MDKGIRSVEDLIRYEKAEWPLQKFYWVFMASFLVLALLGVFGGAGILNENKITAKGYEIKYDRFLRSHLPTKIIIEFKDTITACKIELTANYAEKIHIDNIIPEPDRQTMQDGKHGLIFNNIGNGTIVISLIPDISGIYKGSYIINNNNHPVTQIIYF